MDIYIDAINEGREYYFRVISVSTDLRMDMMETEFLTVDGMPASAHYRRYTRDYFNHNYKNNKIRKANDIEVAKILLLGYQ